MLSVVRAAKLDISDEKIEAMVKEADADSSGECDFDEFVRLLGKQMSTGGGGGALASVVGTVFAKLNPFSWFGGGSSSSSDTAPSMAASTAAAAPSASTATPEASSTQVGTAENISSFRPRARSSSNATPVAARPPVCSAAAPFTPPSSSVLMMAASPSAPSRDGSPSGSRSSGRRASIMLAGTPVYVSPEQEESMKKGYDPRRKKPTYKTSLKIPAPPPIPESPRRRSPNPYAHGSLTVPSPPRSPQPSGRTSPTCAARSARAYALSSRSPPRSPALTSSRFGSASARSALPTPASRASSHASTEASRSKLTPKVAHPDGVRSADVVLPEERPSPGKTPGKKSEAQRGSPSAERLAELRTKLRPVFTRFDVDGSGTISTSEMGTIVTAAKIEMSDAQLQAIMKEADPDGSGEIDFDEFVLVLRKQIDAGGGGGFFSVFSKASDVFGFLNPFSWFAAAPEATPPPPPKPDPRSPIRSYGGGTWRYHTWSPTRLTLSNSARVKLAPVSASPTLRPGLPPRPQAQSPSPTKEAIASARF